MYYFYLLQSIKKSNEIYTGSTNNLKVRLNDHNKGKIFSTRRYLPWRLVYYEAYVSERDARLREQRSKKHGKGNQELKKRLKNSLEDFKKGEGFTLVELIISFSVFVILVSLVAIIFTQTLRTQKVVSDLNVAMNNVSFVTEQMAREIRTGTEFNEETGDVLTIQFTNALGERVSYKKLDKSIGRCVGGCNADGNFSPITSPEAQIKNLKFILRLKDEEGKKTAPRITIITSIAGPKGIDINLQTTISSRVIEGES